MVKIRLTQTGSQNRRAFRIIAIDESRRRDGRAIENLGFFNPLVTPNEIVLKRDRIAHWVSLGAQITPAVEKLMNTP